MVEQLERIGKYEIIGKIGEGGFGIVYKGRDPFIKRLVAVKTCSSENEQIQQRFFREAEIAGNLHHANVVTIHDFGIEGDTPYLVQEFLTGEDLDVQIKQAFSTISLPTKVRYLRGIAEGLRYAHSQGVIHRDIKPANIRVLESGRVKVMDFGIAKLRDQESQLTQTGMALGTVAYMSPEQLKGEKIDHRADIFSYGVLAYELLAGQRPFRAETVSTLFYQLLHEPPPPLEAGSTPQALIDLVNKCLAKTLPQRYQSFDEVIADLDAIQSDLPGADEDAGPDDPFRPDVQSGAESTALRLVAKTQRSLDAGDAGAAAATIDLARREVDTGTFDRLFGHLVEALQELEASSQATQKVSSTDTLDLLIADADLKLTAEDLEGAELAVRRLELHHAGEPRVRSLRQRLTALLASRPTMGEAPGPSPGPAPEPVPASPPEVQLRHATPPASARAAARAADSEVPTVRERSGSKLPAIAAAAVVLILAAVLAWVFLRPKPTTAGGGSGDQVADTGSSSSTGAESTGDRNATPAGGAEAGQPAGTTATAAPGGTGSDRQPAAGAGDGTTGPATSSNAAGADRSSPSTPKSTPDTTGSQGSRTTPGPSTAPPTTSTTTAGAGGQREPAAGNTTSTAATQRDSGGRDTSSQPAASSGSRTPPTPPAGGSQNPPRSGTSSPTESQPADRQATRPASNPPADTRKPPEPTGNAEPARTEAKPEPTTPSEPSSSAASVPSIDISTLREQNAIRQSLQAYQAAWKSLDHEAINLIHPAADLKRKDVRLYREADVELRGCTFEINGDKATARCDVTRTLTPKDGAMIVERFKGFQMSRRGSLWIIDSLIPGG